MGSTKWWIAGAVGAVVGAGVYFAFDPAAEAWFPKCPFWMLTGWECPGCGSQRAIHALLHGDLWGAVQSNVLFVVGIPYAVGSLYKPKSERGERIRRFFYGPTALRTALGVILVFWVVRNL